MNYNKRTVQAYAATQVADEKAQPLVMTVKLGHLPLLHFIP